MESLVELLSAMIRTKRKHRELGPIIFILIFLSMTLLIFRSTNHSCLILNTSGETEYLQLTLLDFTLTHNFGYGASESVSVCVCFTSPGGW